MQDASDHLQRHVTKHYNCIFFIVIEVISMSSCTARVICKSTSEQLHDQHHKLTKGRPAVANTSASVAKSSAAALTTLLNTYYSAVAPAAEV
jgi:hypothetical protein